MKKGLSVDTKGNVHADTAFLDAYVAKGGQVQPTPGTPTDTTDALLNEVGKGQKASTKTADTLHNQVQDAQALDVKLSKEEAKVQKQAEIEAKKAEEAANRLNKNRISQVEKAVNGVKKATDPIIKKAGHFTDRFSRARTVGGIGLLLFILVFLLFIVVEVNAHGDTRIKQLWYMLLGRAALIGRRKIIPNATPGKDNPNSLQELVGATALLTVDPTGIFGAAVNTTVNNIQNSFRSTNNNSGF